MERYEAKRAVIIGGTTGWGSRRRRCSSMGRSRSGDGSLASRPRIGAERAWDGCHRGFERRAVVDGHRRPRRSRDQPDAVAARGPMS